MKTMHWFALAALGSLTLTAAPARAGHVGWSIGVNLGAPVFYRPWYPYWGYGYYYPPCPVYVAPSPVVVEPAPVLRPVPVAQTAAPQTVCQAVASSPVPNQ